MKLLLLLPAAAWMAFGQQPAFEVASIKPAAPADHASIRVRMSGGPGTDDPGRWNAHNDSLAELIQFAYRVRPWQVSGPPWLDSDRFDVTAKLPPGPATVDDLRAMVANLLQERFHLAVHREQKEAGGYELTVAKTGPKLAKSPNPDDPLPKGPFERPKFVLDANGFPIVPEGRPFTMSMGNRATRRAMRETMEQLAMNCSDQVGKPVVDATGLEGKFDFTISWILDIPGMPAHAAPGRDAIPDVPGPTLFQALQEQLGLRLESKKVMAETLVVDKADRAPTEN